MIQRGASACVLLFLILTPAPASAEEWLSGRDLEQSCEDLLDNPQSADGVVCLAFMQGFISGADTVVGSTLEDTATSSRNGEETYAERAARTRLGTIRLQRIQAAGPTGYCIDDEVMALEVVRKITAYIDDHPEASDLTANDAVREALIHHFPCDQ